jgi:phosphate-selective porin OprO/OprP
VNGAATSRIRAKNSAWQLSLSWVLTGENASFNGVTPRSAFGQGGLGALELAARVQGVDFDDDLFPLFASAATSIDRALGFTVGINWYLNRFVRFSVNYDHVYYDGGAAGGRDRRSDDQLLTRVQLKY